MTGSATFPGVRANRRGSKRTDSLVDAVPLTAASVFVTETDCLCLRGTEKVRWNVLLAARPDNAAMSPDGTWIVYRPNEESGVYAQPVSGTGLPRQIASNGSYAVWRGDGKEILYFDRNQNSVSSVRVEGSGEKLQLSIPQSLFTVAAPMGLNSGSRPSQSNRDGSRIYFLQSTEQPESGVINVRTGAVR